MKRTLQTITRAELETMQVTITQIPEIVFCDMQQYCSRKGIYDPCYSDLSKSCPFHKTYSAQQKSNGRLECIEESGGNE